MTAKRWFAVSLGTRIFLITALLILLAVGSAVVFTVFLANQIARQAVDRALDRSAVEIRGLAERNELQLGRLASAFTDPALIGYVAQSMDNQDAASILDILQDRQSDFGFNFAVVLDPLGRVVARTDRRGSAGQSLAGRPLVRQAMDSGQAEVGAWSEGDSLYKVVAAPLATSLAIEGYMLAGFKVDEAEARGLAEASGTQVAYLAETEAGPKIVASTLPTNSASDLMAALRSGEGQSALEAGGDSRRLDIELGGERWVGRLAPILDSDKKRVGATVTLASLNEQLAPFRRIQWMLLVAGAIATALASALSYSLSKRTLGSVKRLAASAEAARQGDYKKVAVESGDEVGQLAAAFNQLLSDLREKRDMESYLGDLSRNLPEPAQAAAVATAAPHLKPVTLLTAELRRYARKEASNDPEQTLRRMARDLRRAETAISTRHGRLETPLGHRLLAVFEGEGKSMRALAAAAELVAAVGAADDAFDEPAEPLVALASGVVSLGTVAQAGATVNALLGMPVQKLESLMREATPGELLLTREVYDELSSVLSAAGIQAASQRGVVNPMPYFIVSGSEAARLTGVDSAAAAAPTLVTMRSAALAELGPGKLLGARFEIVSQLGSGGMGVVYKARDRELDDMVALKVLRRGAMEDPVQLERLKDELRLARRITHPNVLRTFDFGEIDGVHFISMEYVRGVTLRYMLDQAERLPFSASLRVAKQLCAGLSAAHAQGVVHRDIKPDNLILDQAGNAKLMDFGIARPVQRVTQGLTQAGWIVGTPQFMAPEQLEGRELDGRADIYSTGVLLFELFTGRLPFTGDSPMQVAMQHLSSEPPAPHTFWAEIPPELERIIMVCLAKKPENRFAKVDALFDELERLSA